MTKIFIVVRGGLVQEIFQEGGCKIDCEILDYDCDIDEEDEKEIKDKLEKGLLKQIY